MGAVFIVDNLGDDPTTATTLRKAIADAADVRGAVIGFDPSLAGQTILLTEGALTSGEHDLLFIDGADRNITIEPASGATSAPIFRIRPPSSNRSNRRFITLQGLTCKGGGQGVVVDGTEATLNDCRLIENSSYGALATGNDDTSGDSFLVLNRCEISDNLNSGLYATGARASGTIEANDCSIHHNTAQRGGGGIRAEASEGFGNVTVRRSTISYNSAPQGGGLYIDLGFIELFDSTVSHNTSQTDGGGAFLTTSDSNAILEATGSTFSHNSAPGKGGAVFSDNGSESKTLIFERSTVAENTADEGGAFYLSFGDGDVEYELSLRDTTVSANTASTRGGGFAFIHAFPETTNRGDDQLLTFENSIIAGNTSPFSPDILIVTSNPSPIVQTLSGTTLFSSFEGSSFVEGDSGTLLSSQPLLSPLGDYGGLTETVIPLPGSPAIDAVTTATTTVDQRGFSRFLDGDDNGTATADLGSVEAPNYANPGPDDFLSIWLTDQDQDGSPWGLEQAIGTDPAVADSGDAANLSDPCHQCGRQRHSVLWPKCRCARRNHPRPDPFHDLATRRFRHPLYQLTRRFYLSRLLGQQSPFPESLLPPRSDL